MKTTHTPLVVPTYGYENADFLNEVWALLENKISKQIENYVNIYFDCDSEKFIIEDMFGIGYFYLEFECGKELTLTDKDIENGKSFIRRQIAIKKEQKAREKISNKYEKILAPILTAKRPAGIMLIELNVSKMKPIIRVIFENGMTVFIDQERGISYSWEKTVQDIGEAEKYIEQFSKKNNEITDILVDFLDSIPPEFWDFSEVQDAG